MVKPKGHLVYSGMGFWAKNDSMSGRTDLVWIDKFHETAHRFAKEHGTDQIMTYIFRNDEGKGPEFKLFFGLPNASKVDVAGWLNKKKEEIQ